MMSLPKPGSIAPARPLSDTPGGPMPSPGGELCAGRSPGDPANASRTCKRPRPARVGRGSRPPGYTAVDSDDGDSRGVRFAAHSAGRPYEIRTWTHLLSGCLRPMRSRGRAAAWILGGHHAQCDAQCDELQRTDVAVVDAVAACLGDGVAERDGPGMLEHGTAAALPFGICSSPDFPR